MVEENVMNLLKDLDIDEEPYLTGFSSSIEFFWIHELLDCTNEYG